MYNNVYSMLALCSMYNNMVFYFEGLKRKGIDGQRKWVLYVTLLVDSSTTNQINYLCDFEMN